MKTYGCHARKICELSTEHKLILPDFPHIEAEVIYACREYACTIEDVLSRRTRLAFLNKNAALNAIPKVGDIMQRELGWSSQVKEKQMEASKYYIDSYGGPELASCQSIMEEAA